MQRYLGYQCQTITQKGSFAFYIKNLPFWGVGQYKENK